VVREWVAGTASGEGGGLDSWVVGGGVSVVSWQGWHRVILGWPGVVWLLLRGGGWLLVEEKCSSRMGLVGGGSGG
jgi:hypothetical protein